MKLRAFFSEVLHTTSALLHHYIGTTTSRLSQRQEAISLCKSVGRSKTFLDSIDRREWVAQLLLRLFVGYFFMETGWGKIHNLDGFAQRFAGWGIPYPYFNATLSAYTELIGGLLTASG